LPRGYLEAPRACTALDGLGIEAGSASPGLEFAELLVALGRLEAEADPNSRAKAALLQARHHEIDAAERYASWRVL
jgi:hypothetical protein